MPKSKIEPDESIDESSTSEVETSSQLRGPRIRQVPAVTRAVAILRLLGRSDEPLGVNRIARQLGLIPSTALHILRVLIEEELVTFDPHTKRYDLDVGVLTIARSALRRNTFIDVIQPLLDGLARDFRVTMLATQIMGPEHMIVVAVAPSPLSIRLHADLGTRLPAFTSATGRCLAAFERYSKKELESRFKRLSWAKPPSFDTWYEQIQETRRLGYGIDIGEYIAGISIVAVPILHGDRMTHSVVGIGLREQLNETGLRELAAAIRNAAESARSTS
jgi:DNA-binding IclR family transcriptional regulator